MYELNVGVKGLNININIIVYRMYVRLYVYNVLCQY